jgi:hypothetical protein
MKCDQCDSATINGVFCHEFGCPNKNPPAFECRECGSMFDNQQECYECCQDDIDMQAEDSTAYDNQRAKEYNKCL